MNEDNFSEVAVQSNLWPTSSFGQEHKGSVGIHRARRACGRAYYANKSYRVAMNGIVAKPPITATEEAERLTAQEAARAEEKAKLALQQLKQEGKALIGKDGIMVILDDTYKGKFAK